MTQTYREAFPDFPADDMPTIPDGLGFVDTSWHNNACPCFTSDDAELTIWIDYKDPAQREISSGTRFTVEPQRNGIEITGDYLNSDDWNAVLTFIENQYAEVTARKAQAQGDLIRLHFAVRDRSGNVLAWGLEGADNGDFADFNAAAFAALNRALRNGIDAELIITKRE